MSQIRKCHYMQNPHGNFEELKSWYVCVRDARDVITLYVIATIS